MNLHSSKKWSWAQKSHLTSLQQALLTWSYFWQRKHCLILHSFSKYSHVRWEYSFSKSFLIKWFVIFALTTSMITNAYSFFVLFVFFIHVTFMMFIFLYKLKFYLMIWLMTSCWLTTLMILMRISCVITTYVRFIVVVEKLMSYVNARFFFIRFFAFFVLVNNFKSSLNKRFTNNMFFFSFSQLSTFA